MKQIKPGEKYIHFKNKDQQYEIVAIAKHSDNEELMVIYKALYGFESLDVLSFRIYHCVNVCQLKNIGE